MTKSNFIKGHSLHSDYGIKKNDIILGIACYLHDSAAAVLISLRIWYKEL